MAFKDDVLTDLDEVFFNMDEFADEHLVNGETICCVVEGLTTNQAITKQAKHAVSFEGIANRTIVVHVRTADLLEPVSAENIMELDGTVYRVADCTEDKGLTTIILEVDIL